MITFRDSNKSFKIDGDLLKLVTVYKFNADHSTPQDKKLIAEFAREMNYDTKSIGRPSPRYSSFMKILISPAIMAFGISKTIILSSDPNEFCDRIKLLLHEKHGGNNSNFIDEEIVAIADKVFENKCKSKQQHK